MKGFKHTGNGPKYGSFTFSSKAGFGPSSGTVKNVSGYSRRAPKRVVKKAVGGIVEDNIVEAPGFSDYAEGGKVKTAFRVFERKSNQQIGKTLKSADDAMKKRDNLDRKAGSYVHGFEEVKKAKGGKVSMLLKGQKVLIPKKFSKMEKDHIGTVRKADTMGDSGEVSMGRYSAKVKKEDVRKSGLARGGKVPGVSNPMTARQAMQGSVGFSRSPKIGK